ncbi:MAG: calcium-binding protein, partial [Gammaproteobacteria bacterium]
FYGEINQYSASWLSTKELNPYKIEKIKFTDGTVWNYEDLMSETINGTGGAGSLYGYDGNDQLNGLDGNDDLHGGWGDDVLDGGAGNDTLDGGTGNDVYVFARGSGQDVINDNDAAQGNIDTVEFGADIIPADVHVTHDTQNVYLTIDGSMDRVKLSNWLTSDAYKIEQVKFADGTVWNRTTLFAMAMQPSDGGDRLFGDGEDNVLSGLGGDDTLYGQDGNDTLMGGADNDTLHGGTGTDTLDGGSGMDTMDGGAGSDAYVFHRGYGRDTVSDWDASGSDIDVVQFGPDIAPSDVRITRDAYHLYFEVDGTSDRLTLLNYFNGAAYRIEQVKFADGTLWTDLESRITWADPTSNADTVYGSLRDDMIDGLEGNDTVYGEEGNDTLNGGDGADILFGGAGDDTLDGGAGNDTLNGGESYYGYAISNGNDIYLFGRGSGQDVIFDNAVTAGNRDTVQMAPDVLPSDVRVTRDYQNLYLSINGATDRLTLQSWFVDDAHKVE